jgi:hypothetical protein
MKVTRFSKTLLSLAIGVAILPMAAVAETGPSTTQTPYLNASNAGIEFTSILSVGDVVKKKHKGNETYRMVGIPDGLGAYDNNDGTITVLMNHELGSSAGIVRDHGAKGAFVSKWQIRKNDLKVLKGEDLIQDLALVDPTKNAFNRFCSADLAVPSAFFNSESGKGFNEGRIFLNGEETTGGRAFAHLAAGRQHGTTYELAAMGTAAWENIVASPFEQDKTVVAGMDDGDLNDSKLYFYIGEKQEEGNPIELAGLTGGTNYQVKVADFPTEESITKGYTGPFSLVTSGGTGLNRVEDGAWDTQNANRFYFVTTSNFAGNSRLWSVTFADIAHPELGGEIKVLVDGIEHGIHMMDNIVVDQEGHVIMQEDIGNQKALGKIWSYNPATGVLNQLAEHDVARFGNDSSTLPTAPFNQDEESSGIIEVTNLFADVEGYSADDYRYFLLDVQAHYTIPSSSDPELVQGGQLLMMKVAK